MQRQARMLELLQDLVNIDSDSYNKTGVDQVGKRMIEAYKGIGFKATLLPEKEYGNHIVLRDDAAINPSILVLAHMDTVFPKGTTATRPFSTEGDYAFGPGVADMKGSLVTTLFAIERLVERNEEARKEVEILLTSDEEIGAPSARSFIEAHVKGKKAVLVMEPARKDGSLVTFRRGGGRYTLKVYGVAAHSGNEPEKGASAIEEMAYKTIGLHGLSNKEVGIQINVGMIKGGVAVNTIADYAEAEIDVRISTKEQAMEVDQAITQLCQTTVVPGTSIKLEGGLTRPPMERNQETVALFSQIKTIGQKLQLNLTEASSGGGSDASFASALGVPTIDGMGPIGAGFHGQDEYLELSSLESRSDLLYETIKSLVQA
ncbi:acetylornithine deacetylase/succinyl-diaminopimelate desuccinylase [Bacillus sp. JCM 19046]|nr:acetylornithine deacetylase/succinyl-diaminopimelate desuccinylase [Bacillus sp. JCM 19045]GAF17315.1 acetylornithine deacetylase/succinyl-diaminopimelate desuccinylase [Bacillus sp. JCM 19046]